MIRTRATYAELLAAPDHHVAQLINGELFVTPRPAIRHARASTKLGAILDGPFDSGERGESGWIFLDEPELHFGEDVIIPDLAGWRRPRFPPEAADAAYVTVAPDCVCEVVSPRTERLDRAGKADVYAREGVAYFWLINPAVRTLEVLRLMDGRWLRLAGFSNDDRVRAEPFQDFALDLAALWWDPR